MPKLYGYISNTPDEYYGDIQESNLPKEEKIRQINQRAEDYRKQLQREALLGYGRIGAGALLEGASMLPISKVPVFGTALGGGLFGTGDALIQGKPIDDIFKEAMQGLLVGGTVGAIPFVGDKAAKTKAGQAVLNSAPVQAVGNALNTAGEKFANTKLYDILMTDIKGFNPFKQTAYHGSPYNFNKFSNEAIGTGEGAQAHGYGHYAAMNKGVANRYAGNVSELKPHEITYKNQAVNDEPIGIALSKYKLYGEDYAISDLKMAALQNKAKAEKYKQMYPNSDYYKQFEENATRYLNFANNIEKGLINKEQIKFNNRGQLYKLAIPKRDVMLREDLPFSQQPKQVQEALKNIANNQKDWANAGYTNFWEYPDDEFLNQIITGNAKGKEAINLINNLSQNRTAAEPLLNKYGVKGISYNGGIDGEAAVIFNPDDIDIVRKFYTKQGALDYLKKINPNIGSEAEAINAFYNLPKAERDAIKQQGKSFAKENMVGKSVNVPGYTDVSFTNQNLGEDYIYNMSEYPTLFDRLSNSKYHFSTNYKREKDRLYDHLLNTENDDLFDYLIEVIEEADGTMHHNYKMMKNLKKGDKP